MKVEVLGLNHSPSFSATCHTVTPRSSALSSGHFRIAPPHSSSGSPRCFAYQAASSLWLPFDLMNTPPMPVTFAMPPPLSRPGLRSDLDLVDLHDLASQSSS